MRITRFFRDRLAICGLVLLVALVVIAGYSLLLNTTQVTYKIDPGQTATPPSWNPFSFGTDSYGRNLGDVMSIALANDLYYGLIAAFLGSVIGIVVGAVASYVKGKGSEGILRFTDVFLSIPSLILALAVAAILGRTFFDIVLALVIAGWAYLARVARGAILTELNKPYVESLQVLGIRKTSILFKHVLRNVGFFLASIVALNIATMVTALSVLEYIGFGVGSLSPELGSIIAQGQPYLFQDPWLVILPSILLVAIISTFTLLANAMRHLDPRAVQQ